MPGFLGSLTLTRLAGQLSFASTVCSAACTSELLLSVLMRKTFVLRIGLQRLFHLFNLQYKSNGLQFNSDCFFEQISMANQLKNLKSAIFGFFIEKCSFDTCFSIEKCIFIASFYLNPALNREPLLTCCLGN